MDFNKNCIHNSGSFTNCIMCNIILYNLDKNITNNLLTDREYCHQHTDVRCLKNIYDCVLCNKNLLTKIIKKN